MSVEALEAPPVVEETSTPTEAPAAPEAQAPSAPVAETGTTEPAAATSTRPRGPDGRFIKADGTQATEAEHAAIESAIASPSPPTPTPAPSAPPEPFTFRADGQRIPIPGSSLTADGALTIPADQVPVIRQLLAEGVSHRGSWRQKVSDYERQIKEAAAVQTAEKEKYHSASLLLFEKLTDQHWLTAAASDPREVQHLVRELGLELKQASLKVPKASEAPPVDQGQQQQALLDAAKATLSGYVEELLESPQARAIYTTPEEREAVKARYTRRMAAYFVEQDGDTLLHENAVDEDFKEELKLRQDAREAALKASKAAEFNAKRNAPAETPPPVVSTKGPGSNASGNGRVFKDREEYRKAMGLS